MIEIPTYNHEFEFQEALKRILEKKNHVEKVVIKRRGADLEVYHDGAFKNLHPRNVHIKLSNPFFIETKLCRKQTDVIRGIRQSFVKYSHRSETGENKTCFLATPESIFSPPLREMRHWQTGRVVFFEPNYFPEGSFDWSFRFIRTCWVFDVGVVGGVEPTLFALNDLDKFYLEDKV